MPDPVANPFGGIMQSLPIGTMFAAPLMAAIDCHTAACVKVADFIDRVGFNPADKTVRMVRFAYKETVFDAQGSPNVVDRVADVPFLAMVPLPSLGVKTVGVDFDLQVDTSDTQSSSTEASASLSGSVGFAWWKVEFKGSVTHKSEQTRKTDTRAKYTVHLEVDRQDPPEALMRVIDAITQAVTRPIPKDKAPALPEAATK
jgi:Protein of unknown function (DUF2589)